MALFCPEPKEYITAMKQFAHQYAFGAAMVALGVAVFALATGVAFASWMDKGAGIFMATVESGLAWCF